MSARITFVIGGARSGKSSFVLREISEHEGPKAYIATGEALDDEMQDRIQQHREDRGAEWVTYEEPVNISGVISEMKDRYRIIVLDCLTLWLSNVLIRQQNTADRSQTIESRLKEFLDSLKMLKDLSASSPVTEPCAIYIVSNEVGMGIVPKNPLAREFRDLAGFLNQRVAEVADEVYMVTAGIPVKIK